MSQKTHKDGGQVRECRVREVGSLEGRGSDLSEKQQEEVG